MGTSDDLYQATCAHGQKTQPAVGMQSMDMATMANKQMLAICDARGLCQTIQSMFEPVFCRFQLVHYAYDFLRYLDVQIWRF